MAYASPVATTYDSRAIMMQSDQHNIESDACISYRRARSRPRPYLTQLYAGGSNDASLITASEPGTKTLG
eukprot:scaffold68951_cov16-Prasinocladus_malaysianus.AAC.1